MQNKKCLVFVGRNDYMAMEAAADKVEEGYEIWFVACDHSAGICHEGNFNSKVFCGFCAYTMRKQINAFMKMHEKTHYLKLTDLITTESRNNAESAVFNYDNVKELKAITYKGVDIGYGAFSNFVSQTRNVMPTFNSFFKEYINTILREEMMITDALLVLHEKEHFNFIVFHNGRFPNYKPAYCIARNEGIDYIATEVQTRDNVKYRNFFYNNLPHSFEAINEKIERGWDKGDEEKYNIGKLFFENRYHSKPAGDKVYTKDQHVGELPVGFDKSKFNIAIFNSSEDEYFAINKEYDDAVLFPNQYIALKSIFDHFKNDDSIHFYLRIHPNLATVPYKSHTMLYDLKYDNVTIIPPKGTVSSYALMDACDNIVVFNSTMGMECSYWGKPVIALSRDAYSLQDITYNPKTAEEAFNLIKDRHLVKKERPIENWLKVAYYYMGYGFEEFVHYPTKDIQIPLKPLKGSYKVLTVFKFMESSKLQGIIQKLLEYTTRTNSVNKFNSKVLAEKTE